MNETSGKEPTIELTGEDFRAAEGYWAFADTVDLILQRELGFLPWRDVPEWAAVEAVKRARERLGVCE